MVIHLNWHTPIHCCLLASLLLGSAKADVVDSRPSTQKTKVAVDLAKLLAGAADGNAGPLRSDALQKIVDAAQTPLDQAQAQLALANWALAVPTARPATRWLMGFPAADDSAKLTDAVRLAETNLEKAQALLKPEAPEAKERRRTLRTAATTLEAFAKFFAAMSQSPPKGTCAPCSEAALGLAVAREAENPEIASAALLWQSLGWELAGRRERALTSLPNALQGPQHLPYDFMSRLLRCRLLAESGQKPGAIALTVRIQALCDKWFPRNEGPGLEEKRRLVAILQYKFIREWMNDLDPADQNTAKKIEAMLNDARKRLVDETDSPLALYYLESSIPILVEPPKVQPRIPTSAQATPTTKNAPETSAKTSKPE